MLLPFMTIHLFQLHFAGNVQCWHSSRLIILKLFSSLTFFMTDNKHVLVWCRFPRMGEAYVDTIIRYSQDENLGY